MIYVSAYVGAVTSSLLKDQCLTLPSMITRLLDNKNAAKETLYSHWLLNSAILKTS